MRIINYAVFLTSTKNYNWHTPNSYFPEEIILLLIRLAVEAIFYVVISEHVFNGLVF